MKFNFKKIMSVLASTVMLSSTIALAAAASYPAPFVSSGNANVAIVYGSNAGTTDLVAVSDIQTQLATDLAQQTTSSTSGTGVQATGGDSVNLASSSQNLFYSSSINSAKTTLTNNDLPNVLASGTVTDNAGNSYTYTQSISLGSTKVSYGVPSGVSNMDPIMYLNVGNNANPTSGTPAYTYKLTFNKPLNVSNTNVVGNTINIMGTTYTIGANSLVGGTTNDILYLYGSGNEVNVNEGSQQTVTVNGQQYTVAVTGITQSNNVNQVYVSVNGGSTETVNQGSSSNIGGLQIYAKTIYYNGKTGTTDYATLDIGSNILQLQNNQEVAVGTNQNLLQGTYVTLGGSSTGMSSLSVSVAEPNSTTTYIGTGQELVDPVFGGAALQYADTNPALNAATNDNVTVDSDGSRNLRVSFNSALSGSISDFNFLHDNRTSTSSGSPLGNLGIATQNGNYNISLVEGAGLVQNEYTIIDSGDYGRLVQVGSLPSQLQSSGTPIQLTDAITNQQLLGNGVTLNSTGQGLGTIDGQTYYFNWNNSTVVNGNVIPMLNITWSPGSYNSVGSVLTVDPRIKLQNGEWLALLAPVTVKNGTTIALPGVDTVATYAAGSTLPAANTTGIGVDSYGLQVGNLNYTFTVVNNGGNNGQNYTLDGVKLNNSLSGSNSCILQLYLWWSSSY